MPEPILIIFAQMLVRENSQSKDAFLFHLALQCFFARGEMHRHEITSFLHFHSNAVLLHCQISRYAVLRPPFLVLSSAAFDHFDIKGWFSCIHKLLPGDILMCFMFYAGKQHLSEKTLFPVFPGSAETLDRLGVMIK